MLFLLGLSDILGWLGSIVGNTFNILWGILCIIIYNLITYMFHLFNRVSQLDLLQQNYISGIYQRVTMIITIVMVFYITFECVKYVVSPETMLSKDKGAGQIVKRIVTSILLIAFVPTIFSIGMDLQNRIIKTNVISKVILGNQTVDSERQGSNFSADVFSAFYRVNPKCNNCSKAQEDVNEKITAIKSNSFSIDTFTAAFSSDVWFRDVTFDGLLAVIFGCFICYVLFSYDLDMATRYFQLIFLQITAPIAIISNIAPSKDSMLKKWTKQCITTYIDIFIRIAILNFLILVMQITAQQFIHTPLQYKDEGYVMDMFVYIIIITGLMLFLQRMPKLLKELLPSSGGAASIGFGFAPKDVKKKWDTMKKPASVVTGAAAGMAGAFASMKRGGIVSKDAGKFNKFKRTGYSMLKAGFQGGKAGFKSGRFDEAKLAASQSVRKDESIVSNGGTPYAHDWRSKHFLNKKEKIDSHIKDAQELAKRKSKVFNEADEVSFVKSAKSAWESARSGGKTEAEIETARKEYKRLQKMVINGNYDSNTHELSYGGATITLDSVSDQIRRNAATDEAKQAYSIFTSMKDTNTILTAKDEHGNRIINPNYTEADYIESMGDIETIINDLIRKEQNSKEYQEISINSEANSGKK